MLSAEAVAWLGVVGFGVYHGLNPSMGWPLAVANGLAARRDTAVFATVLPLGVGHLLAMAVVLVPFTLLAWYVEWSRAVRIAAGLMVLGFGVLRLARPRHPRFLARVPPTRLAWWSFLMATAHGAGLMLVPIALGLCASEAEQHGHLAIGAGVTTALLMALVHTAAMLACGLALAWTVYRWLGLRFLSRGWFNLETVWAVSLVLTGAVAAGMAWTAAHDAG
ncbi:MAG TPA: hypothetical protein VLE94_23540 [Burkholderiaceae bacterium]|nr:hypothetical protein [Burkholderiaceae bacterium]